MATVQGNQLVLSGGAKISTTQTAVTSTATTITVKNINDIITPGAGGITYASTAGGAAASLGGIFGAGGAGGTIAQLQAAIAAREGDGGTAEVLSNGGLTLTLSGTAAAMRYDRRQRIRCGGYVPCGHGEHFDECRKRHEHLDGRKCIRPSEDRNSRCIDTHGRKRNISKSVYGRCICGAGAGGNLSQLSAAINSAGLTGVSPPSPITSSQSSVEVCR